MYSNSFRLLPLLLYFAWFSTSLAFLTRRYETESLNFEGHKKATTTTTKTTITRNPFRAYSSAPRTNTITQEQHQHASAVLDVPTETIKETDEMASKNHEVVTMKSSTDTNSLSSSPLPSSSSSSSSSQKQQNIHQMALLLISQYFLTLRQEESILNDKDVPDSEKIQPMKRYLKSLKHFGCSPIQYIQYPSKDWKKDQTIVNATAETILELTKRIEIIEGVVVVHDDIFSTTSTTTSASASTSESSEDILNKKYLNFIDMEIPQYQASDHSAKTKSGLEEDHKIVLDMNSKLNLGRPIVVEKEDALTGGITFATDETKNDKILKTTLVLEPEPRKESLNEYKKDESETDIVVADPEEEEIALLRKKNAKISHSFQQEEFKPVGYLSNPHVQTIMGVVARQNSMYLPSVAIRKGIDEFRWDKRQRMTTIVDDDFFDVDWKFADNQNTVGRPSSEVPLVLICHGLQSSSDSPLCKDMALAYNNIGMDVACINFRGCSGEPNRTPMGYHLSFTDDLEQMVQYVHSERPNAPIYLSGFSLGANVVTKFLADQGVNAVRKYNIGGAAVNAIPFNLTIITSNLNEPCLEKTLYGDRLRKSLIQRVNNTYDMHDYPFTREKLLACETINEFEDLVLPAVYNFTGVYDYLEKSSIGGILDKVMVPELVIQALDDPFFQGNINPANNPETPLRIQYTEYGGHCGYIFHSEEETETESSWMPRQMARYIEHVHKSRVQQTKEERPSKESTSTERSILNSAVMKLSPSNWRSWATNVAQSFETEDFKPAWFAQNNHFQTIVGTLAREDSMYYDPSELLLSAASKKQRPISRFRWDYRQRFETPDGDFFDVDYKYLGSSKGNTLEWDNRPIVLICHGLQSNSNSPLAKDMANAFNNAGMHVACINFRGCSGEINRTPYAYHLGFTDDLKQTIAYINQKYPNKRIYLSGFSLGANVVTTYLSEMGEKAIDSNVIAAAVNAVPFDMTKANLNLNQDGLTKSLYGDRLLKSMIDRVEDSYDSIDFDFPIEKAHACKTIMDMENLVIAPVFGFDDAWDYYKKTSTGGDRINMVNIPQYIIQSRDDPFFKGQTNPPDELNRPVRIHYTDHGGHCGYVFHERSKEEEVGKGKDQTLETSWMPTELARFLAYVDESSYAASVSNRHRLLFQNKEKVTK